MEFVHKPVLVDEVLKKLNIKPNGIYIDGTIGGGGHAYEIMKNLQPDGLLIGIDQDPSAIRAANDRLKQYRNNLILINDNFRNIKKIIEDIKISKVDGILLDIGVSSYQLDKADRGFSYMKDGKLDMRMDKSNCITAEIIVNDWSQKEIGKIIKEYGEEKWAQRIATFICEYRLNKRIETTYELVDIIKSAIPAAARRKGPHPAKRTFQAIRIAVNDEIKILEKTIEDSSQILNPEGRLAIITFHSLEDRIVKSTFRRLENPCTCPPKIPMCVCGKTPLVKVLTKKPIIPDSSEINDNPRSRSAKLRVVKRLSSNM